MSRTRARAGAMCDARRVTGEEVGVEVGCRRALASWSTRAASCQGSEPQGRMGRRARSQELSLAHRAAAPCATRDAAWVQLCGAGRSRMSSFDATWCGLCGLCECVSCVGVVAAAPPVRHRSSRLLTSRRRETRFTTSHVAPTSPRVGLRAGAWRRLASHSGRVDLRPPPPVSTCRVPPLTTGRFRFKFEDVLRDILPYDPEIVSQGHTEKVREWLQKDEIDNLVLTTCKSAY